MNLAEKISLITITYTQDDLGEWTETETKRDVYALVKSVTMYEFYQAGLEGMKPDFRFHVWMTEYKDEELVEYKGKRYRIYRTYIRNDGRIELYVNRQKGDGEIDTQGTT